MDRKRWTFDALASEDRALVLAAHHAAEQAYAPYSGFAVGAASRTRQGGIHLGCNVENAAYGVVLCAEVGALAAARVAGEGNSILAIAVTGRLVDASALQAGSVVTPCGRCRQLILEASHLARTDIRVLCCNHDLGVVEVHTIESLLPHGFGPASLGRF